MANTYNIYNILKNVEISCKTPCKSRCKSYAKLCEKLNFHHPAVEIHRFPQLFPVFPTHFPTTAPPPLKPPLFHFCTTPTITTTNNI